MILVENVKSLIGRWVVGSVKKIASSYYCPILGKYEKDELDTNDYTYTVGEQTYTVFNSSSSMRRRKVTKTGEVWEDLLEVPINLVDGSTANSYVFINDQAQLGKLAALWNEWISNLSKYSATLTVMSKDIGVNVCCSIGSTDHWIPKSALQKKNETEVQDTRIVQRRQLSATPYANKVIIAYSSHDRILSPVFDTITKVWVNPVNQATINPNNPSQQSPFQRQQIISGETYSVGYAAEDGSIEISTRNSSYAAMLVRGVTTTPSEIEEFFRTQSAQGTGGLLSGLAASFLGKAFGSTVGSIAGTVAEVLPI